LILIYKNIYDFFSVAKTKDFFVCDQLLQYFVTLEQMNFYVNEVPIKEICVYRDPRDQFLSAFRWDFQWMPRSIDKLVSRHRATTGAALNSPNPNRLMVRFEDLVLKYDETTQKIMEFCGIDPKNHVRPKSVFDPAISAVNIGAWKNFVDQDFMRQIEERLGEYCYYPEKENLSEEAWALLKATR